MKNVLVIGSINIDMVIETEKVPQMGETLTGSGFLTTPGGKGANQAVASARLGNPTRMIGRVGSDIYGGLLLDNLKSYGVDTCGIQVSEGESGVAVITVCHGDNYIILDQGANAKVSRADIDANEGLLDWADVVLFQFEIPVDTVAYAMRQAKSHGCKVLLNPAPMKEFPADLLQYADLFIPNQTEAALFLGRGIETLEEGKAAAAEIRAMGCGGCIITMGSLGCVYTDGIQTGTQGIFSVRVQDTTAAGDSFIAGLCAHLEQGLPQAVRYASAVSALAVSKHGAQVSLPAKEEVEEFLRRQ